MHIDVIKDLMYFFLICPFQWGQNLSLMYDRVLRYPDRVRNLYFTYLFVLRAVTKVSLNMSACQSITLCLLGGILKRTDNILHFREYSSTS